MRRSGSASVSTMDRSQQIARTRGRTRLALAAAATALATAGAGFVGTPAFASSVTSAVFTGGAGTGSVGGVLYAKNTGALTLTVTTSSDTLCVDVAGAFTGHQTSNTAKSSWTFTSTAGAGDGVQTVTATASPSVNGQGKCTGSSGSAQASYTLDNTGPTVTVKLDKTAPTITGSRSPAANANGWNNADVTASFTCSDALSGVKTCSAPTTLSSNGANQSVTGTAADSADNSASATVSGINIDKSAPTLSGAPATSPNGAGWYNGNVTLHWTCADQLGLSGINGSCPADSTIASEGTGLTGSASVSD